jgi:hypothetical protein
LSPARHPSANDWAISAADYWPDENNVEGQNQSEPPGLLNFHDLAYINGVYYDPSYGLTYNSLQQLQDTLFTGFYKAYYKLDPNGPNGTWVFVSRQMPAGLNIHETVIHF